MRHRTLPLAVLLLIAACGRAGAADCSASAAPGVDWQRCYVDERNLTGRDLTGARLRETSFQRSILTKAVLAKVDGYRSRYVSATLKGAGLDGGNFIEADFTNADLSGASLRQADLSRAHFFRANLRGADLTGAILKGTDFTNADLSGARWVDGSRVCAEGSIGECS